MVVMTLTGDRFRGSALLSAAPFGSVDLIIKSRVQAEIRLYCIVIQIHNPTVLLPSYAYFSLYLSTDSLYVKFVAVTWESHITAVIVVVDLKSILYPLFICVYSLSVLHFFFLVRETSQGPGLFIADTYLSHEDTTLGRTRLGD